MIAGIIVREDKNASCFLIRPDEMLNLLPRVITYVNHVWQGINDDILVQFHKL
jgi:hypothetical protein